MQEKESVIIVDDEELLLRMLSQSLEEHGFACRTFAGSEQALAALEASRTNVLITDIAMPGMKGLELTKEVKRRRPEIIVIIMTGFVDAFSYDQAIEAGASDFIKKPFTIQELLMRIKHVKMQEKLRTISITDELTGLLNRRGFFALAQQQLKVAARIKGSLTLLFADVDGFKAINDTYGHQEGDEALKAIAAIFRRTFRDCDIIARMSGDEFAILLIDTPEKNCGQITKRLEQQLAVFNDSKGVRYHLEISFGMVVHDPALPRSIDDLLKAADALMYAEKQRKKRGRPGEIGQS